MQSAGLGPSISSSSNGSGGGVGGGISGTGLGNFKGVMLCNRPFGGTEPNPYKASVGDPNRTFRAGVVPAELGQTVMMSSLTKSVKRPKKVTALTKHRKWLQDLQKTKDELEQKYIQDMDQKRETQEKFSEREAKLRQIVVSQGQKENEGQNASNMTTAEAKNSSDTNYTNSSRFELKAEDKLIQEARAAVQAAAERKIAEANSNNNSNSSSESKAGAGKLKSRPAWALTEDTAAAVKEDKELEDDEGLLNFAAELNFDRYIDDLEVRTMMEKVRKRIMDLEREVTQDERRVAESEARAKLRALNGEADDGSDDDCDDSALDPEEAEQEAALAAARALLAGGAGANGPESLKNVHSTKSVAALVRNAAKEENGATLVRNEPKIVTHDDGNGARLDTKNNVSNLPYIRRNPAV